MILKYAPKQICVSSIITLLVYKLCSINTALFSGIAHEHARVTITIRVFGSECLIYSWDHHWVVVLLEVNHIGTIILYICYNCQRYLLLFTF